MKTALLVIATGEKYHKYIDPLIASAQQYLFPHDVILWTDSPAWHTSRQLHRIGKGFPYETLHRYHTFMEACRLLNQYDFLLYSDVDMLFTSHIREEDVVSSGITATLHPGYVGRVGTPERRSSSYAYIPPDAQNKYFCGGFNGGRRNDFIAMSASIKSAIDADAHGNIVAVWHDESHLNEYLYRDPPARILGPEYCYPEGCGGTYAGTQIGPPKLVALTKEPR